MHNTDGWNRSSVFPAMGQRPLLAIITEPNACDSQEQMEATFHAIQQAVSTQQVDLVSVRLNVAAEENNKEPVLERACELTRRLVELAHVQSDNKPPLFYVVCSSDLVSVAVKAQAHGVHVKEHHMARLVNILAQFEYPILFGTSVHSLPSLPCNDNPHHPHYYIVGTCYMTTSHPEKSASDLEGPELPGKVKHQLAQNNTSIPVFAVGGIDESNCHEPVALGADGVAVIRAVLYAKDPADMVQRLQEKMTQARKAV